MSIARDNVQSLAYMTATRFLALLKPGFSIPVGCLLFVLSSCNSGKFQKSQIAYKSANLDSYALSPDGSLLAIFRAQEHPSAIPDTVTNELEVMEVKSSKIVATVAIPTTVILAGPSQPQWSFASTGVRYCDRGKYILANGVGGTFYVVDTESYKVKAEISFELDNHRPGLRMDSGTRVVLAVACAANANVAAFELVFGPYGTGLTKAFNLDTGKQTGEIAEDISAGRLMNLDVSPSGTNASILVEKAASDGPTAKNNDLVILNLGAHTVSRHLLTGMGGSQAAFVADSSVAVAGNRLKDRAIKLFDVDTGAVSQSFGEPPDGARASVAASADGKVLLGYTGSEGEINGALQIHAARFTLWDRQTGKIIARSPELPVSRVSTRPLDLDPGSVKSYQRPQLEMSQSGNAVLVVTLFAAAPTIYTLK
jgi:hypothetical protein